MAFAPDGKTLVASYNIGGFEILDAATGKVLRSLSNDLSVYTDFLFRADGRVLFAASDRGGHLSAWKVDDQASEPLPSGDGATGLAPDLSRTDDGSILCACGTGRSLSLFSGPFLQNYRDINIPGDDAAIGGRISPDGTRIAVYTEGAGLLLIDATNGATRESIRLDSPPGCVRWLPGDDRFLVGCVDGTARLHRTLGGRELRRFYGHSRAVSDMAVTPDGHRFASASGDGSVRMFEIATGRQLVSFRDLTSRQYHSVSLSPDGRRAVTASDETITIWNLEPPPASQRRDLGMKAPEGALFGLSGDRIITYDRQSLSIESVEPGKAGASFPVGSPIVGVSTAGARLASAHADGVIRLWELKDPRPIASLPPLPGLDGCWLAGGEGDVLIASSDKGASAMRVEGGKVGPEVALAVPGRVAAADLSGDGGSIVAVPRGSSRAYLLNASDGKASGVIELGRDDCRRVRCVPGGKALLAQFEGGEIHLWDIDSRERIHAPLLDLGPIRGLDLSADPAPQRVATAGEDGKVRLWDPLTGREALWLDAHNGPALAVSLSPSGDALRSVGRDGTLRTWRAEPLPKPKATP